MRGVGVLGIVLCGVGTASAGPLDKPAFTATADELLAEAKRAPAGDAAVVVLRDDAVVDLDAAGRSVRRYHMVYVVEKQSAVDDWGDIELGWSPFYQDKPTIRARVITARDQLAELDQALVKDAPTVRDSSSVYSDRRKLEAPLPRLAIGAVVEEEMVVVDRAPLPGGSVEHETIGRGVPVQHSLLTLSAPTSLGLRVAPRGFAKPPTVQQTTRGGRTTWRYDFGPTAPNKRRPDGVPNDLATWPAIGYATAASWQAIATAYAQIIDKQIADGPLAVPPELAHASVEELVAWVHAHVRYTGIEIAEAALVPWTPAVTVSRGFGDCKDKATLLVAMLRAAGISAQVALVDTGPGLDLDRQLPGLGEFDHAIVLARVAGKDVWIDATESDVPAGRLPPRDQGRLALIAAAGTTGLVLTPSSAPADNAIREVRTLRATEQGAAAVTEVETNTGTFADTQRAWIRDTPHDQLDKSLGSYVDNVYRGKLASFSSSDPRDLAHPFALTVEVTGSGRLFTKRESIDGYVYPSAVLGHLPKLFDAEHDEPRTFDYVWSTPHVVEIETRMVLPDGYAPPALTAHEDRKLGTMSLAVDRRSDGNTLVITYRLDTGKLRITAAELAATVAAVRVAREETEHVAIQQTGAQLFEQGKIREALAEYERLVALHPKEALHHDQIADVYRRLGLGAAARRAARAGVDLEPKSADAHDMLAWQLGHDTLGRQYGSDADRKGAIAEYTKALALDPKHNGALIDFANLLSHDAQGRTTDNKADRIAALALRRRANEGSGSHDQAQAIARDLLRTDQRADAEAAIRALPESADRSALLLAAIAAARDPKEAIQLASSLQDRARTLRDAGGVLMAMRRYAAADALVAASGIGDPLWPEVAKRLAPVELTKLDPMLPETPVRLAIIARLDGIGPRPATVTPELLHDVLEESSGDDIRKWLLVPRAVGDDILVAVVNPVVEGSPATGWHVMLSIGSAKFGYYVASVGGRPTLLGDTENFYELGRTVRGLLAKNDVAAATRWIDWFAADAHARGDAVTAARFYRDELARAGKPSREVLELVATILVADKDPAAAVPVLRRCAISGDAARRACDFDLLFALRKLHHWTELVDVAKGVPETTSYWALAQALAAEGLYFARDGTAAAALLDAALAKRPDDEKLISMHAKVALGVGGWDATLPWLDKLLALPAPGEQEYNNAAWLHLYYDPTPDKAHELGVRAEQSVKKLSSNVANTLAAIEAESDRPRSAVGYLWKSLAEHADRAPRSADWYVIGRIAESVGLRDDALAAYRRVDKDSDLAIGPTPTLFAARGLARLNPPASPAPRAGTPPRSPRAGGP